MKRFKTWSLFIIVLSAITCIVSTGKGLFAQTAIDLIVDEQQNGEKDRAIDIAQDLCAREGLTWDDVTIKHLGGGMWRVVVISLEQGKTGVIEVNAVKGFVVSKSFK